MGISCFPAFGIVATENKGFVWACFAIALLGFRIQFPALRNELNDTLFIATSLGTMIAVFQGRK